MGNFIGLLVSVIAGVAAGILFALNVFPFIAAAAWIAFGLGVLSLLILISGLFSAAEDRSYVLTNCLCRNAAFFLTGIIGTILTAIVLLSINLVLLCIPAIILVGIGTFFFSLMIFGLIFFICCIMRALCRSRRE